MKVYFQQFIFAILLAILFPFAISAQLPNLGTAMNFAVFTTIGALNNIQTSNITGDVGTNNGGTSGFTAPTVVNGNIESLNAATAQCAIDVQNAYNEIFLINPTVVDHSPSFGSNEILQDGVYFINQAGSLAGILTLDAAGDSSAIFIFQFGGAFTTSPSSIVNLINGASSCNVFWIAEGAINMADLTEMKGSLISNNGAISLGEGGILEGRMLTTCGEASVNNVLINIPICNTAVVLTVDLFSFDASCDMQNVVLKWKTLTEINNNYFSVERSTNGNNWCVVGKVDGAGNSFSILNYTLIDLVQAEEITYYRLKQTDFDGNFQYEDIISVHKCKVNGADPFTIVPNPSKGKFELLFSENSNEINSIDIFNSQGYKVYSSINVQSIIDLFIQ